ncbi:23S ribosomal RNA methyltransferase [Agrocybe pediades]|nr:23S ribosomal RNA methyltransferase [Agrocybe pediades]
MAFRQSFITHSQKSKSKSASWASRQIRDPYVKKRLADPAAYRARSAFKLLEINSESNGFLDYPDVSSVVDLGAAPGGWSQVLDHFDPLNIDDVEENLSQGQGRGTIVAVDLLKIEPIPGVKTIQADFLEHSTTLLLKDMLRTQVNPDGKADVILSDMAANVSGNNIHDIQSSLEICEAVFEFARWNLRPAQEIGRRRGGVLLMKFFAHPLLERFRDEQLKPNFNFVTYIKPDSSRATSREGYFLCQGWRPTVAAT